jgi:hypothetical protein
MGSENIYKSNTLPRLSSLPERSSSSCTVGVPDCAQRQQFRPDYSNGSRSSRQWQQDSQQQRQKPLDVDSNGDYQIRKGDSVWTIGERMARGEGNRKPDAKQVQQAIEALIKANPELKCNPDYLRGGGKLHIPGRETVNEKPVTPQAPEQVKPNAPRPAEQAKPGASTAPEPGTDLRKPDDKAPAQKPGASSAVEAPGGLSNKAPENMTTARPQDQVKGPAEVKPAGCIPTLPWKAVEMPVVKEPDFTRVKPAEMPKVEVPADPRWKAVEMPQIKPMEQPACVVPGGKAWWLGK